MLLNCCLVWWRKTNFQRWNSALLYLVYFPTTNFHISHLASSSNTRRDICRQLTETMASFSTPGVSTIQSTPDTVTEMWLWKQILGPIQNWSRLHLLYLCMNLWSWAGTILCAEWGFRLVLKMVGMKLNVASISYICHLIGIKWHVRSPFS